VSETEADNPRDTLRHLMRAGLAGRNLAGVCRALNRRLAEHHNDTVAFETFIHWYEGDSFPRSRVVQNTLGDIVGGAEGEAIKAIADPAFRNYRSSRPASSESGRCDMSHHGLKKERTFALEPLRDGSGKMVMHSVIVCVQCGTREHHLRRSGVNSLEHFERAGWQVGTKPEGDKCPHCRKVIAMKEHRREPAETAPPASDAPPRQKTPLEKTTIARYVIDNFDEEKRYKPGWNDTRISKELNVPCQWVSDERLHFYPDSVGEDPNIDIYLEKLRGLEARLPDIDRMEEALIASAAKIDIRQKEIEEDQKKLRKDVGKFTQDRDWIRSEIKKMQEVEATLRVPFDQRKSG
jgi:hypothetical protein